MEAYNFTIIIAAIAAIAVFVLIYLTLRRFFCWYFKTGEILKKQDEIIDLLKAIKKPD
jgi:hypothetical protein